MAVSSVSSVNAGQSAADASRIAAQQQQQVQQQQQAQQQRDDDDKAAQQRVADTAYKPPGTGALLDKLA